MLWMYYNRMEAQAVAYGVSEFQLLNRVLVLGICNRLSMRETRHTTGVNAQNPCEHSEILIAIKDAMILCTLRVLYR